MCSKQGPNCALLAVLSETTDPLMPHCGCRQPMQEYTVLFVCEYTDAMQLV